MFVVHVAIVLPMCNNIAIFPPLRNNIAINCTPALVVFLFGADLSADISKTANLIIGNHSDFFISFYWAISMGFLRHFQYLRNRVCFITSFIVNPSPWYLFHWIQYSKRFHLSYSRQQRVTTEVGISETILGPMSLKTPGACCTLLNIQYNNYLDRFYTVCTAAPH